LQIIAHRELQLNATTLITRLMAELQEDEIELVLRVIDTGINIHVTRNGHPTWFEIPTPSPFWRFAERTK
jgi:hypothetical protein